VLEDVGVFPLNGFALFAPSAGGSAVYVRGSGTATENA
jgi:hypothetical protein